MNIDVKEYIEDPSKFDELSRKEKVITCTELSDWLTENEDKSKSVSLLKKMAEDKVVYPIIALISIEDVEKLKDTLHNIYEIFHEEEENDGLFIYLVVEYIHWEADMKKKIDIR